ncbi:MAG: HAD-IIIA family hydrolase [Leptospiraceae bacterium]|nr:HAD-IIIA family hydrolase [Leptospiraceae bacterium]MDW8305685.1 HAD-IIIA family hydrolase [Leptospiraceae bacterium]
MRHYRHIIFDWDGTLAKSIDHIVVALQMAGQSIGRIIPEDKARYIIGLGIEDARRYLLGDIQDIEVAQKFHRVYRQNYLAREKDIPLYPCARELVQKLYESGHKLTIATGKSREGILRALEHKKLQHYFQAIRTSDMTKPKPNPNMVWELCEEVGLPPSQTLLVGDTIHDLEMANRAGIDAVGVTYGAHKQEELAKYPHLVLVDSLSAFYEWYFS